MDSKSPVAMSSESPDAVASLSHAVVSDSPVAVASLSPDSMVIAPDSFAPESVVPESVAVDLLVEQQDTVAPESESIEIVPDTVAPESEFIEFVPDSESIEIVPDSVAPESEHAPDSLPPGAFVCGRCGLVHENREAWDRAHSVFWPCSRCGLVHFEWMLLAMFYGFKEFDCKVFMPDLDKVQRHGDKVVFDANVLQMLRDTIDERELAAAGKDDDTKATVR